MIHTSFHVTESQIVMQPQKVGTTRLDASEVVQRAIDEHLQKIQLKCKAHIDDIDTSDKE